MREFPDQIFSSIEQVFIDTTVAVTETGDLIYPLKGSVIDESQVIPLSDLILKNVKLSGETRFFKSVGMASFDLYAAKLVYESLS